MNDYPWFKAWSDICTHPKTRRLSSDEFRLFVACMTLAADRREEHGRFYLADGQTYSEEDLADHAKVPVRCVGRGLVKMIGLGLLSMDEDGIPRVTSWDERQFGKPSNHPEAARDRKRKERVKEEDVSRECHAVVTPESRACHATDPDPELDPEREPEKQPERGTGETAERPSPPADPPAPLLLVDKPTEPEPIPGIGATEREAEIVRALVVIPTYDATATETLALVREMAALWPSVDQRREVPSFREWWLAKDARHPPKRHRWKSRWANWVKRTGGAGSRASPPAAEPVGRGDAITVEERQHQIELARAGVEF